MVRVMAQGTFDVLHPGHLHYLERSAELGDVLAVVVAKNERVSNRKDLLIDQESRRDTVAGLKPVDEAYVGESGDIYGILKKVRPDIVTVGYDQPYDLDRVQEDLEERGYGHIELVRVSEYEPVDHEIVSSSEIKRRARERYGSEIFESIMD